MSNLQDQFQDGSTGPLKDICPFTAMGIFNRGITDVNRKNIATELATFLGVEEVVPDSLEGIPILNNQKSWFFGFDNKRKSDDIDALWEIFARAITFSDSDDADIRADFISAYDSATERFGVGWNLTMGLYWIRPWNFPTLDGQSQRYISKKLNIKIGLNGPKGCCNANDYIERYWTHWKHGFRKRLIRFTPFQSFPLLLGFLRMGECRHTPMPLIQMFKVTSWKRARRGSYHCSN